MKIFTELLPLAHHYPKLAVALGTFDGIHLGHQHIISRAVDYAKHNLGTSAVFTFSNHPLAVLAPAAAPPAIISQADKAELLEQLGVDVLINIPATAYFLQLKPQEFIQLLNERLQPALVVVGPNYSFGANRAGTPAMLAQIAKEFHFKVEIQDAIYVDNILVSSTVIRQLIASGKVDKAASLLGRYWHLSGIVERGDGRGRKLGFPTANIALPTGIITPADGVYAVTIEVDGNRYNAVANVGNNPTFSDQVRRVEVHIPDFNGDLYGRQVRIYFRQYLRDETKFSDVAQLIQQIKLDIEAAKRYYINE